MSDPSLWDKEAESFDQAVDHGLLQETARRAWEELLLPLVETRGSRVADLGCGTGTLSALFARHGHDVTGVDFSPRMIELAREKARSAGISAAFVCADASSPPLAGNHFDVVLSRHVLWAMPEPAEVLRRWVDLLRPGGLLILIEGRWNTNVGLEAETTLALLDGAGVVNPELRHLPDDRLWGRQITDERYIVTAHRARPDQGLSGNSVVARSS